MANAVFDCMVVHHTFLLGVSSKGGPPFGSPCGNDGADIRKLFAMSAIRVKASRHRLSITFYHYVLRQFAVIWSATDFGPRGTICCSAFRNLGR
jgi:hypothetical protein